MSLTLLSPAKVNLFLRILGKRRDGYHALASLFQTIDLADTLTFTLSKEDSLTCTDSSIVQDNLVWKALELFRRKTGLQFNISIHLEKKIPLRAGLGGGSSNAATTLKGVNQLLGSPLSHEELQNCSSEIGSDIPFFFSKRGTAYCTGRGEIVRELPAIEEKFEIYKPKEGLSTADVYKALDLSACSKEDPEELLEGFIKGKPKYINDLEIPAFKLMPSLARVKEKVNGTMSGSGTAFFFTHSAG
ncbi:MAG: 4-(cytidine 5'-diphospho)-2-C-methyl-D-erythritol kinase [Chlamydiales bacterium]|nr:4-(cytidine 5'-diphospho)-2-C-methyl-D-erythritol kinase [Chlamydiales bacterium]